MLQPGSVLKKNGVLQVLTYGENQTVLQYLKHLHLFRFFWRKKGFTCNMIFLRTKNGICNGTANTYTGILFEYQGIGISCS